MALHGKASWVQGSMLGVMVSRVSTGTIAMGLLQDQRNPKVHKVPKALSYQGHLWHKQPQVLLLSKPAPTPRPNGPIPTANGRGKPQGKPERGFGPAIDTNVGANVARNPSLDNLAQSRTMSPVPRESPQRESPGPNGRRTPTQAQQTVKTVSTSENPPQVAAAAGTTRSGSKSRQTRQQNSIDSTTVNESSLRNVTNRQTSPPPPTRQTSNPLSRKGSARNSQTVAVLKELDAAKNRNAWYASELELARKAGYTPNPSSSPILDQRAAESFDDDDKPLIEALIAMKAEVGQCPRVN